MVTSAAARQRGNRTALWVAEFYQANGFAGAEATLAGRQGRDILGMPGCAPEVKSSGEFRWDTWLTQAARNADGDVPWVVYRPTRDRVGHGGLGRARVAAWPVLMYAQTHVQLLHAAGYGDSADYPGMNPHQIYRAGFDAGYAEGKEAGIEDTERGAEY